MDEKSLVIVGSPEEPAYTMQRDVRMMGEGGSYFSSRAMALTQEESRPWTLRGRPI